MSNDTRIVGNVAIRRSEDGVWTASLPTGEVSYGESEWDALSKLVRTSSTTTRDTIDAMNPGPFEVDVPTADGETQRYCVEASSAEFVLIKLMERIAWRLESMAQPPQRTSGEKPAPGPDRIIRKT